MYYGEIHTALARNEEDEINIADKLGKLHETEKAKIYYRKHNEYIRSVVVPTGYPEKILETAEIASLASTVILYLPPDLQWTDGELLLLANSLNSRKTIVVTQLPKENIEKLIKGIPLFSQLDIVESLSEPNEENEEKDLGFVYVDRVFTVKGVGTVVTGFSYTSVSLHEKLIALPYGKEIEIKSIQVLDEDQKEVKSGVRIGFALKNVKEDEIKDTYMLVKPEVKSAREFEARLVKYPWAQFSENAHVIFYGSSIVANIKENSGEKVKVSLHLPIVPIRKIPVININTKPGKPRVVGYLTF